MSITTSDTFEIIKYLLSFLSGTLGTTFAAAMYFKRVNQAFSNRKIAIFAKDESLKKVLIDDSKLFKEKNITVISDSNRLNDANDKHLLILSAVDFGEHIDRIIDRKKTTTPLIIFAKQGSIEPSKFNEYSNTPNTTIANSRGRLLHDIVTAMIATPF